jgi:hypothetical protein
VVHTQAVLYRLQVPGGKSRPTANEVNRWALALTVQPDFRPGGGETPADSDYQGNASGVLHSRAGPKHLGQRLEQGFLVFLTSDVGNVHTDVVWGVDGGPDQPFPGRYACLFGHGPDLRGIVIIVFDDFVYKFHLALLCADSSVAHQQDRRWPLLTSNKVLQPSSFLSWLRL